jgi:heme oxygenase
VTSSARGRLKAATASAHDTVERAFEHFDLSDRADYIAFLQVHAAAVLPIESWLDYHAAAVVADWPERRRRQSLVVDLAHLGGNARAAADCVPFVSVAEPAAIAGVLYVMEGSRLGGRLIARSLPPDLPQTYLNPPGESPSWPALLARLEEILTDAGKVETAIRAALATFGRFAEATRTLALGCPA